MALVCFFSSADFACPGSSVGATSSPPATRQLQHHLPVLSQEIVHCLQKGAKRPRTLPRLWRLRVPQRRMLQTAGYLWMRFGEQHTQRHRPFVCVCVHACVIRTYCVLQHSQHCGAATGIFLLINASVIIIIRGHRFCLWGSVYLDAHGEEDRDLRYVRTHDCWRNYSMHLSCLTRKTYKFSLNTV